MKIPERIGQAWRVLLGKPTISEMDAQQEIVSLRRQLGEAALELHESAQMLTFQKSRLDDLQSATHCCETDPLEKRVEDLAAPLSQLRMQGSLLQSGKDISGRSVMALASKLADLLEEAVLEPIGTTGQEVDYDPQFCEQLSAAAGLADGETVTVKFVGYRYKGRLIRKALVDRKE